MDTRFWTWLVGIVWVCCASGLAQSPLEATDARPVPREASDRTDLLELAHSEPEPIVKAFYRSVAIPHDMIHWAIGPGRSVVVEPIPQRVTEKRPLQKDLNIQVFDTSVFPWKKGRSFPVTSEDIRRVQPYEDIVLELASKFVVKDRGGNRLRAVERVLEAVIEYHQTKRLVQVQDRNAWADVIRRLHDRLRKVRVDQVRTAATAGRWDAAYEMTKGWLRVYKEPADHERFCQAMFPLVEQSLKENRFDEAAVRRKRLEEIFPECMQREAFASRLSQKAQELLELAKAEKDDAKALRLLADAEKVWPFLSGLRNYRLKRSNEYPILYVGVRSLPESFTPATASVDAERLALDLLFEELLLPVNDPSTGQRFVSRLARGPAQLVPLGRRFQIHPQAIWSDGTPVTAIDVRRTIERLQARKRSLLIDEARVGAADPREISITLRRGFVEPRALMTFKILPAAKNTESADFVKKPIGSGPFALDGRIKEGDHEVVRFLANEQHFRQPAIREIHFFHSQNPVSDFATGKLHVLLDPETAPESASRANANLLWLKSRRIYFLAINHRHRRWQEANLRRCLSAAIDRAAILDQVFRGRFKDQADPPHRVLNGPFPPDSWASDEELKEPLFNRPLAKILAKKSNADGFKATLKYPKDDGLAKKACAMIKAQVREHTGMELVLEPRPPALLKREVEFDHDYELAYYHFDYPTELFFLWPLFDPQSVGRGGTNFLGYTNDAELTSEFQKLMSYRDMSKVREWMHSIHRMIHQKTPFVPLWQLDFPVAVHRSVELSSSAPPDYRHFFANIVEWRIRRQ
ncbi:MAG: hypothetical protein KatS3mg105_0469 [Gemmatales bacterium]|nr:MAG: hypothetical protein KatS3mg105_0469 [Gemmatales bacterium]